MDESEKFSISFSPTAVRHECLITFVQLFNTLRQPTALITIFSHQHFSSTLFLECRQKVSQWNTSTLQVKEITIMLKRSLFFFEGEAFIYAERSIFLSQNWRKIHKSSQFLDWLKIKFNKNQEEENSHGNYCRN